MIPKIQPSFAAGELSPEMLGRIDIAKYGSGCSTLRNFVCSYRGGAFSRAGTKFVGQSLQPGTGNPPRLVRSQFSNNQGYALEFGNNYLRVIFQGGYVTDVSVGITNITLSNPVLINVVGQPFNNGDTVAISDLGSPLELSNGTFIVQGVQTNAFYLYYLDGSPVNGTQFTDAYTGGGTVSRVLTIVTPYNDSQIQDLKFTQSADVMSITHPSFTPYDLERLSADNWQFVPTTFDTAITAPTSATCTATVTTNSNSTQFAYVITAVDSITGQESVASNIALATNSVDIAATAGSLVVGWNPVAGAGTYNVYKAPPSYDASLPSGNLFGYAGTTYGTQFVDSNITQDMTQVPPLHKNPFAEGAVIGVTVTSQGTGSDATTTMVVSSASGMGAVLSPVVVNGGVVAGIVEAEGQGYTSADTIVFGGSGSGQAATPIIGPQTGTYPSCVGYFQQRRVYANTNNQPDTYFMSQPGAFTNFDSRIPVIDSDAITGTPWSQQVNGIQFLVPMPGGLVVLTGLGAWQVTGAGGSSINPQAITPSNQQAQPQAYNGCSSTVPPLTINYDILYVQSKGSIVRDLSYNFFVNIYTGTDLTVLSSHLFIDHTILQWAWAEEPFKLIWAVRDDGVLLCLTYLKEQEVTAWTRHDTDGLFVSVCTVTEPPVDAPYFAVKRYIQGQWRYYIERMDDRIWQNDVTAAWCVDAGLSYPQPEPSATLTPSAASGSAVSCSTDLAVFGSQNIGNVLRVGGGVGVVTSVPDTQHIIVNFSQPITNVLTDDVNSTPLPASPGNWTLTPPISLVGGLQHLEGETVTGLADGQVITPQVVTNGQIKLPVPASAITVGLGYTCQLQTMFLDMGGGVPTSQGRRKNVPAVVVRVTGARGLAVGTNQIDASFTPTMTAPPWTKMIEIKERNNSVAATAAVPLFTGDAYINVPGNWQKPGQVAVQQSYPLPAEILAVIPQVVLGDDPGGD
jgi:hypothetical protein